ncbi:hypothetical protein LX15_003410 [Streptoalloteichus tenebrarius]|uniref:C4-type zinc ribbon domain-containing protein n=1 Tax=Streptoalloteichus tenebrarius (strain ATCC 17920 / DSM 40477 / JCM 4838 / CBS 697.72 / NBRC 16177 / NCIMB 11028 / NRRL B-12390 / A12253. 1 / ISP 5477) TaxID=1933 RepID=A0ABT1HW30_STRSD|nr:C4-type zinc ribbon domain-containing protein [Streptoalloteichus tenebrarius]MCP2259704.1 hypothetical protein [Streptoalloteichus tenebrarius]BFF00681.1 C4-type zinc ribbon domain-containing protein [Streptoalloteichus tenebrarius]
MKAQPAAQRRLLDLAKVDAELNRVAHRRRTMPELAEIAELERDVRARRDAVVAVETTHGDLDRDARRLETEIEQLRAREERDRKLIDGGSVGAKQVVDLQHELESLARRRGVLEDELLEVMERREAVEREVAHRREELAAAEEKLGEAQGRRDEAVADLDVIETRRAAERKGLVAELPEDLVALYERIRAQKGTGAGLLRSRRCGACQLELDRTVLGEVRTAAADEVVRCSECGAILVRTGESGL